MKFAAEDPESLYRVLFESATDAIVLVNESGRIVLANAASELLLGRSAAELQGLDVEALVPERFRDHALHRAEYAADPRPRPMGHGLELAARHADGREVPVDISLTPIDMAGIRLVACTIRDLRGRSYAPYNLRVHTAALRSAANGIVITDSSGTIIWVNPAACVITGYHSRELIGQHTRILKSGKHDSQFYADLWKTITRGRTWSGTIVNRRRDGSLYDEEQTIAPVVDETGTVTHFIAIKQDVTEQHRMQEELRRAHQELEARVTEIEELNQRLREEAIRDSLTGLHNRRYLSESIERDVAHAVRSGQPLTLAALDIDRFKEVNDTWGHAAGDRVLQRLAEVLRTRVRASDLLCRVGGEEFVVVMPGVGIDQAAQRADEWRRAFEANPVKTRDGEPVICTVSIGVAMHSGDSRDPAETVLHSADEALYAAKRAGRNRVVRAGQAFSPIGG